MAPLPQPGTAPEERCADGSRCDTIPRVGRGVQLGSGRVIALGRLLLATLFVITIWLEPTAPGQFPPETYALLGAYVLVAAGLIAATWTNWWADAHLAGPAHALDMALFTVLVFLTQGDKRPFFPFFIFVLLSAAIRWGWRATALTAALLTLLYLSAGMVALPPADRFHLERFVSGTGYLVILSLILIWFGVNQWRAPLPGSAEKLLPDASPDPTPVESSLRAAMAGAGASTGAFAWLRKEKESAVSISIRDGEVSVTKPKAEDVAVPEERPFLYDLKHDRALTRDADRNLRTLALDRIRSESGTAIALREGLAIPVVTEAGQGQIYLEGIRGLSTDHLSLGEQIAETIASHMQRQGLMRAAEESAEARSRLAVARDLHDSVVQFLAGAAFRLEAMKRAEASGRDLAPELNELKELMLQEQTELRSFISALRSTSQLDLDELATDLQSLVNRLSRQWEVQCTFSHEPSDLAVPSRLHLDAQQLVREAVANAARHAGAKNVSIRLAGTADELRLDFINDGSAYPRSSHGGRMPRSLRERVQAAGGTIELSRGMGVTKIAIALPAGRTA